MRMMVTPVWQSPANIARCIGAAPTRQQRAVNVEAPAGGDAKRCARQYLSIRHHDEHIELRGAQRFKGFRGFEARGLLHPNAEFQRLLLDRAGLQRLTAPGGTIRLREHHFNGMLSGRQPAQGRDGELRRAGEAQP